MPGIVNISKGSRKRKRFVESLDFPKTRKRFGEPDLFENDDIQSEILLLEENILASQKNFNDIFTLLEYAQNIDLDDQRDIMATIGLCRVFCRLMAAGSFARSRASSGNEIMVTQWLKDRYDDYKNTLLRTLGRVDAVKQKTALALLFQLMKEEKSHLKLPEDAVWRTGIFSKVVQVLIEKAVADGVRAEFVDKYVNKYDDFRFYTFKCIAQLSLPDTSGLLSQTKLSILVAVQTPPEELKTFYLGYPATAKHDLLSLTAHKKQAQIAWTTTLSTQLSKANRKTVLELMAHQIAPWFVKVELLMDFLTDSFDVGGSTSLMALSGLFYLIQQKNLDYPQFYGKLYSLLDANILHSKHRARFFRLLDTFLASTHLPAALVASFIKRLSRLTLYGPPSGIVIVVPWIYNLLKVHSSCTFMLHRTGNRCQDEAGWGDPFRMEEADPMKSNALESSLWEIHTLQKHYHPSVATIAKIISEQFTKQSYNLEDFLDHSYGSVRVLGLSHR